MKIDILNEDHFNKIVIVLVIIVSAGALISIYSDETISRIGGFMISGAIAIMVLCSLHRDSVKARKFDEITKSSETD